MDSITQAVKAIAVLTNFIATLGDPREAAKRVGPASIELHNNVQLPELLFGWLDQLEEFTNFLNDLAGENARINEERLQDLKTQVMETVKMTDQYPSRHPHWWIKDVSRWNAISAGWDVFECAGYPSGFPLVRYAHGSNDRRRTPRVPKSKK